VIAVVIALVIAVAIAVAISVAIASEFAFSIWLNQFYEHSACFRNRDHDLRFW
jgi:hypothetical protein